MNPNPTDAEIRELILHRLHMGFGNEVISNVAINNARMLLNTEGDFYILYHVEGRILTVEDFQSDPYYGAPFRDAAIEIVSTHGYVT
jgi:hypothetical protein